MAIKDKLKEARLKKGLNQIDVAPQLGCGPSTITNWEKGKFNPPIEQLEKICGIYGISPLDLLEKYPNMNDIYHIAKKPVCDRTYEENVALAFSGEVTGWIEDDKNEEDSEIIRIYHSLDPTEKRVFLSMVKGAKK